MADTLIQGTTIIEDKRSEKGEIWSCPGINFKSLQPSTVNINYTAIDSDIHINATDTVLVAPVFLPQGAVISKVKVFGNVSDETWTLFRAPLTTRTGEAMATGNWNSEDITITNSIIDNETFCYFLATSGGDSGDEVFGARINYGF